PAWVPGAAAQGPVLRRAALNGPTPWRRRREKSALRLLTLIVAQTPRRHGGSAQENGRSTGNGPVMRRRSSTTMWAIAALLAGGVLVGLTLLGVRLRPYLIARYRGMGADRRGAMLAHAALAGAH